MITAANLTKEQIRALRDDLTVPQAIRTSCSAALKPIKRPA